MAKGKKRKKESEGARKRNLVVRSKAAAARYLERFGYEVLDEDWACPAGEIDIVARDGDALVFIQVQSRTSFDRGFPTCSVTPEKRSCLEKIAMWYLRDYEFVDIPVRFDEVSIMVIAEDRALIRHYVNAFGEGCC